MSGQHEPPSDIIKRDDFAKTADPQQASPFLSMLPLEIRKMIYEELWRSSGFRQHIFRFKSDRKFSTCRCITDPDAEDVRFDKFMDMLSDERVIWNARLKSEWNTHWRCGEIEETEDDQPVYRDFEHTRNTTPLALVPVSQGCKRLYLEITESLFETITFCFFDTMTARDFLSSQPANRVQFVELSIRVKPIITELYFPGPQDGLQPQIAGFPVTAGNNPWENLCRTLCSLTNLRSLRIYLESEDLRPWHSRVAETKFLNRLKGVKAKSFLLELPELPDEEPSDQPVPRPFARRWERRNPELADTYLTSENTQGAPFTVHRGPRPNNWRTHLMNLGQRGRRGSASRFLAAPPALGAATMANVAPF